MLAKVVTATIEPRRVDDAARAVVEELIPSFVAHPGAGQGYWMANRSTGQVLVMTGWSDLESLEAARAADGTERTRIVERLRIRIEAILTLDVLGSQHRDIVDQTVMRWARATWVHGVSTDLGAGLPAIYKEVASAQARSRGFCASYWLGNHATGNGLALSLWAGLPELLESERDSKHRRRWLKQTVGSTIDVVSDYEALGVVAPTMVDIVDLDGVDQLTPDETAPVDTR
jgi:hypothetical protein